jgi:hypothetical protein
MKLNLRVDEVAGDHVRCTLFMNRANCGDLCFRVGEYQLFGAALLMGADRTQGQLEAKSDDRVFKKWAKAKSKEG